LLLIRSETRILFKCALSIGGLVTEGKSRLLRLSVVIDSEDLAVSGTNERVKKSSNRLVMGSGEVAASRLRCCPRNLSTSNELLVCQHLRTTLFMEVLFPTMLHPSLPARRSGYLLCCVEFLNHLQQP